MGFSFSAVIIVSLSGSELAIDVCILVIEVYISTYQLHLAATHIDFVEARLFADSSRENSEISTEQVEKYRCKLYLFRARLSLLHGNIKNCKKEIKGYISMAGSVRYPCCAATTLDVLSSSRRMPVQCC